MVESVNQLTRPIFYEPSNSNSSLPPSPHTPFFFLFPPKSTPAPFSFAVVASGHPSKLFCKPNTEDDMLKSLPLPDPTLAPNPHFSLIFFLSFLMVVVFPLPLSYPFSSSYRYPQPLTSNIQPTLGAPYRWLNQSFPSILRFFYIFYFYLLYYFISIIMILI